MSWETIIKRKRWDDNKPDMSRYYGKPWAERQKEKEDQKKKEEDKERQKKESMSRNPKGRALLKLQEAEENSKKLDGEHRIMEEYPLLLEYVKGLSETEMMQSFYRFGINTMNLPYRNAYGEKNSLNDRIEEMFFKQKYVELSNLDMVSVESVSLIEEKINDMYYNSEFYSILDFIEKLLENNKEIVPKNNSIYSDLLVYGEEGVTITDNPMPDEQKSILNNIIVQLIENVDLSRGDFEKILRQYEKDKNKLLDAKHKKAKELDAAKKVEVELRNEFRKKYPR
jgi:hypothetical protein